MISILVITQTYLYCLATGTFRHWRPIQQSSELHHLSRLIPKCARFLVCSMRVGYLRVVDLAPC